MQFVKLKQVVAKLLKGNDRITVQGKQRIFYRLGNVNPTTITITMVEQQ